MLVLLPSTPSKMLLLLPAILLCFGIFTPAPLSAAVSYVDIEDFIEPDTDAPKIQFKGHGSRHNTQSHGWALNHLIVPGVPLSSLSPLPPSSASPTSLPLSSSPSPSPLYPTSASSTVGSAGTNSVIFDDEDIFISGSGSGSGDFNPVDAAVSFEENGRPTPTSKTSSTPVTSYTAETSTHFNIDIKMPRELPVDDEKPATSDTDDLNGPDQAVWMEDESGQAHDNNDDLFVEDDTMLFDYPAPAEPQPITSNHILMPPMWGPWYGWVNTGISSRVRVRSCLAKGHEVSDVACDGVRLQIKTCNNNNGQCGETKNVTNMALEGCTREPYRNVPQDTFRKAPPPPPRIPQAPPPAELRPNPDECLYSLFDTFRQKFVFTRWNLTSLITKSKVKRWCERKSGQYVVMTTPLEHCRSYYKDLCKVTQRCQARKSVTDSGDFAEGCWRNQVYGERLPVGLSNKNMKTFFLCQRFAPSGRVGMTFGYKHSYYTTLYDVNMRSPVISLVKVTSLGDDIWPETDYLIEHSLVEDDASMMWRYQKKPKKGMLTLRDLGRCMEDQGCDLGLRQVVPENYRNAFPEDERYTPTHLVWPDLMPSDPSYRLATFTLTNMAPLLKSLYKEWRATVLKVRQFALEQCHIPYSLELDIKHPGQHSTHRTQKSALYIASGALPNLDPVVTTGHDVHVPFLFWMSGCCVQHHAQGPDAVDSNNSNNSTLNLGVDMDNEIEGSKTNVTAFAVYISNAAGSGVIAAPVLQLETLLQDVYKTNPDLDDVMLFPGHDGVCSELKNDVSPWFQ